MIEFRTEIETLKSEFKIGIKSKVLTLGSCFSDVLGNFLIQNKIQCLANPFGNVYNIRSLSDILAGVVDKNHLNNEDAIVESDGVFFHYGYHSEIREITKENLLQRLAYINNSTKQFASTCDYVIITLGTSWVYVLKETNIVVSNCHKQNNALFEKRLLSVEEQLEIFENIYTQIKTINPKIKIILTVSPVRHLKDTLQLNNLSKSILRLLCNQIIEKFDSTFYFPSYEIILDDLRDYRFYKSDLIHPNEQAENYILDIFSKTYFDTNLKGFISEWKKIKSAIQHRPFNPKTEKHQIFLKTLLIKIQTFENQIDISEEYQMIKQQII